MEKRRTVKFKNVIVSNFHGWVYHFSLLVIAKLGFLIIFGWSDLAYC